MHSKLIAKRQAAWQRETDSRLQSIEDKLDSLLAQNKPVEMIELGPVAIEFPSPDLASETTVELAERVTTKKPKRKNKAKPKSKIDAKHEEIARQSTAENDKLRSQLIEEQ